MSVLGLRTLTLSLVVAAALTGPVVPAYCAPTIRAQLIVGFKPRAGAPQRHAARARASGRVIRDVLGPGAQLLATRRPLAQTITALRRDTAVAYVQPNYPNRPAWVPNDPGLRSQWNLHNTGQSDGVQPGTPGADIDAIDAWDGSLGAMPLPVGVVDTGVRFDQPDLAGAFWAPPRPGDQYVIDLHGYNFAAHKPNASDITTTGHGTAVTSIIAARANNGLEIAGVAPEASVIELDVFATSEAYDADIAAALDYAGRIGLRVVNASLGGNHASPVEAQAISAHPNTLYVTAAGNGDAQGHPINVDQTPFAPCSERLANLICVAATDNRDAPMRSSNYGPVSVALSAPGQRIPAAWSHTGRWAWWSGTSMAAPQVAGAAALLFARHPQATVTLVRRALLDGADRRPGLAGLTATGARLDAQRALIALDHLLPT